MLTFPNIRVGRHPKDAEYHTIFVIKDGHHFYYNRCIYKSRAERLLSQVAHRDLPLEHYQASDFWKAVQAPGAEQLGLWRPKD